jgi:hypothetical protein
MRLKNVTKCIIGFLFCSFLMIVTCREVRADIIYEPEDDFYRSHAGQCESVERHYTANGADGNVTLWKSPESKKKVITYENGTDFYVLYTYTDKKDTVWGIVEVREEGSFQPLCTGWIRMKDVVVVYDNISFCEEHKKEFEGYNGEFDHYEVDAPIILWSFPGSGVISGKIDELDDYHSIIYTYMDADSRLWGYYAFTDAGNWRAKWGYAADWICLSDPTNENIPTVKLDQPTIIPPSMDEEDTDISNGNTAFVFLGIAVGLLVVVTAVFIRVFWKKNGSK